MNAGIGLAAAVTFHGAAKEGEKVRSEGDTMGTERREGRVRPAIYSPDRRSRPEAAGLRAALVVAGGV